uniref:Saposin B-type domain-containing protein n=1 Tax=Octopus bimaculoides TaxID=37653 RepID=A0A0L8IGH8_OCTBM
MAKNLLVLFVLFTVFVGGLEGAGLCNMYRAMDCVKMLIFNYKSSETFDKICRNSQKFVNCARPLTAGCGSTIQKLFVKTIRSMRLAGCPINS